ncbi:MAG: RNA polymerase factor sigma-54 [Desulfobacterales bacterium]
MALKLAQQLKLSQQMIMTPQLQMSIKLLQLSRMELMDVIHQELEKNPALEEILDIESNEPQRPESETEKITEPSTKEITIEEKIGDDIDWSNYLDEYSSTGRISFESEGRDSIDFDSFSTRKESLKEHLLWQLLMTHPTAEEEKIGSLIIGNLNKDGYLDLSDDELIRMSNAAPQKVKQVLSEMQTFDPAGVCARNLNECLLIQAENLGLKDTLVTRIINDHLNHLEIKNYKAISKALKVSLEETYCAVNVIKGLEPKPGREFNDEEHRYIVPDIYVYKLENDFVIMLNDDGMPKLRISAYYQQALSRKEEGVSGKTKEYIKEKLRSASWLIKSIHQRQKTIYKVMESLLKFQRDFFEHGIAHLRPLVLKDVAEDIDMHESTISRVTTNKYAYTPQGIFELKFFFNSSINRYSGEAIASASVQEKIRKIIESESLEKPYSDRKIASLLKEANINIARRTVAKYRESMKILSSSKRKQI